MALFSLLNSLIFLLSFDKIFLLMFVCLIITIADTKKQKIRRTGNSSSVRGSSIKTYKIMNKFKHKTIDSVAITNIFIDLL